MIASDPDGVQPSSPDEGRQRLLDRERAARVRLEHEKQQLLVDWVAGGGSADEFEVAWPEIQAQLGKIRVMGVGERARGRSLKRFTPSE